MGLGTSKGRRISHKSPFMGSHMMDALVINRERLGKQPLDFSQWWDGMPVKNSKSPHFRHKIALWIERWLKSQCVRTKLCLMMQQSGDVIFFVDHGALGREYNGLLLLDRMQFSVGVSSTITTVFGEGPAGAGNFNSCGTSEDVRTLCKEGRLKEAMHIVESMDQRGLRIYSDVYVSLLQGCISMKALAEGKWVHDHIIKSGWEPNIFIGNMLINMYAKCGSVVDARQVFDKMSKRNVFTWSTMIAGYAKHGQAEEALKLFGQMNQEGLKPTEVTFVSVLNACASLESLEQGMQVHADIIGREMESNVFVRSALVDMYAKCGSIEHAIREFNKKPIRDVVLWNTMIAGYVKHGRADEAFKLFWQMEQAGLKPREATFISVLKACASLGALEHGKKIHTHIIKYGFESYLYVGSTLVDMYTKCGSVEDARQVFNRMPKRNVVLYNAMLAGYAQHGQSEEAFKLFWQMEQEGVKPDEVTFLSILSACASVAAVERGKQIHARIIRCGLESDVFVGSSLVDMYAKCGSIQDARQAFNKIHKRDVAAWNTMIAGYAKHGHAKEVFKLFWQMEQESIQPNRVTFLSILDACASPAFLEQGKQIHHHIIRSGLESDVFVGNSLVDMYAKCGCVKDACQVFRKMHRRDVVSWNTMIAGCAQQGHGKEALSFFQQMRYEGVKPNEFTFASLVKACSNLGALEHGKQIHVHIIKSGFGSDVYVGNSLIDMYAKCGSIKHARLVFDEMPKRDVVSWNTMIAGYAQHGLAKEVLQLIEQMQGGGQKLDHITFVAALSACSHAGLVDEGRHLFNSMSTKHGLTPTEEHYSCMVDLLGRAGHLEEAYNLISKMLFRPTPVVWKALLGACRIHGNVELAKRAAEHILELDPQNAGGFVLLSNIYAASGRWDEKTRVVKGQGG